MITSAMNDDPNIVEQAPMPKRGLLLSKDHSMALLLSLLACTVFENSPSERQ